MRTWRYAANASYFGLKRDRFTVYQPAVSVEEKIRRVAATEGLSGIELKYPFDFEDRPLVAHVLRKTGLTVTAINVDIKDAAHFRFGALSAPQPQARDKAVALLTEGMDLAAELGCGLVATCPLADGFDYPFQIDYAEAWGHLIETTSRVCRHRSDVRLRWICPHEPHAIITCLEQRRCGSASLCRSICPNVGANLDVGHSFAAREAPAQSAALLAAKGRMFYVHANDNTGDGGDWDMLSGSVHFWHWVEFLLTLDAIAYDGWISADIMPKFGTAQQFFTTHLRMIRRMCRLIEATGTEQLRAMVRQSGNTPAIYDLLTTTLEQAGP